MQKSKLDIAGMTFLLCGDDDREMPASEKLAQIVDGTERTSRIEMITGLSNVQFVTDRSAIHQDGIFLIRSDHMKTACEVPNCIEGQDFVVVADGAAKNIELKSISQYLSRFHGTHMPALNVECGTVYFELYDETGDEYGWLHHFYIPDKKDDDGRITKNLAEIKSGKPSTPQDERKTTYVRPDFLIYLIFADEEGNYPVAAISFEWNKLAAHLNEMAEGNFSPVWRLPPKAKDFQGDWWKGSLLFGSRGKNSWCWHVSTEKLKNLARVTMIGLPDRSVLQAAWDTLRNKYGTVDLMEKRLEWLREQANGRLIPYEYNK